MWKSKFRLTVSHQITCCVFLQKQIERENWNFNGTYIPVLDCINPTQNITIICTNPYKMLVNGYLISYKNVFRGQDQWELLSTGPVCHHIDYCRYSPNAINSIIAYTKFTIYIIIWEAFAFWMTLWGFFLWMNYNLITVFIIMSLVFLILS